MTENVFIWLTDNLVFISLALSAAVIIMLVLLIALQFRLKRLVKAHKSLMHGMEGKNFEELLETYLTKVKTAEAKVQQLNHTCDKLNEYARKSLQNVALVRFNAFENMGSDLSFATALLDMNGDGVVLSSINSREESRVYAKPIEAGNSTYHLSSEEVTAIKKAMDK